MTLTQWLPFVETARRYEWKAFRADALAGLAGAIMVVPQCIAYAMIAGLPPIYGFYSAIVVATVGALMGSSEHLICGPTNSIAIVIATAIAHSSLVAVKENPAEAVLLLAFMVGVIQFAFGVSKLGNLSQFVSRSVVVGFTAGAGLLIALNQLNPLLGLDPPPGEPVLQQFRFAVRQIAEFNPYSLAIGAGSLALMLLGSRWLPRWLTPLVVVSLAAAAVWAFRLDEKGVALVGQVPNEPPMLRSPRWSLGMMTDLADSALAIAILGCIETLSIAKGIGAASGQRVDANQGFIGVGLANIAAAFFQSMPGSGSFVRSALNHQVGGRTRFAAVTGAVWVAGILFVFAPLVSYVPNAALAGMLIVLGLGMFQWHNIRVALHATRSDAVVLIMTFAVAVLVNLRVAIYVGVISSLALFLRKASAPHLVEYDFDGETMREISNPSERSHPEISIIHVEGELFFGAAELFQDEVRRVAEDKNIQVVILRMKNARNLDATAVMALEDLLKFLVSSGRLLLISGASSDVIGVLRRSGLLDLLGEECVFEAEGNLTAATRKALIRAQQFLGKAVTPEVRVFYDKSHVEQQPPPPQRDTPEA